MLESYLSPYLLSYVNKYIKNIKPEDLQVSLWGGDLVLTQLDLRLDVLEKELHLPLSFSSGHIRELKIHIPWTALGSEPAVITINTIEFVVKLKDGCSSDGKSESTVSSKGDGEDQVVPTSQTKKHRSGAGSEFTPGYIQSLTRRIINNAHIVINNLILKYVEEDIVLSVNVKSVESYATDAVWERAFIDLSLPELVLRRLCTFSDITVCLDKRNASGKIEIYQEPVIYHWNLTTRIHMTFKGLTAKAASVIKVSTFCDELNLSLSETQLPMFIRLVQLVLALYYGTLDLPETGTSNSEKESEEKTERKDAVAALNSLVEQTESQDGWGSWAWSMVPQVFTYDDEEEEQQRKQKISEDPIIAVGFYCRQGSVTFKLSDITNTGGPFSSSRKLNVQPFLQLSGSGMSLEILVQGLAFFNVEMGFSHIAVQGLANCTCGVDDFNITLDDTRDFLPFIECGDEDLAEKETNYLTTSLFDPVCPENLQNRVEYILDQEKHHELFTEDYGKARFGAFWADYVFTMIPVSESEGSDAGSVGSDTLSEPIFTWKELSWKKFILFPCKVTINSSLVHRMQQLWFSAQNHEYEPYSREKPEIVDENRPVPTREQVTALEEHVPSRSTQFSLLGVDVQFLFAEHPHFTAGPHTLAEISNKEPAMSLSLSMLPSLHIQLQRLDLQTTVPMYARRLVKAISKLSRPSGDLLYHCYTHTQLKVFGLEAAFSLIPVGDVTANSSSVVDQKLLEPTSLAAYQKTLVLAVYWKDTFQVKKEIQMELPKMSVKLTKPQTLLASHLYHSWVSSSYESDWLKESSLIDDAFPGKDKKAVTLEASVSNIALRFTSNQIVWAVAGTVEQSHIIIADSSKGTVSPIMQGPAETDLSSKDKKRRQDEDDVNLITFTVQMKKDKEGVDNSDGLSVVFVDVQGMAFCLDPSLLYWLIYQPKQRSTGDRSSSLADSFQEIPGMSSTQKKVGQLDRKTPSQIELQSLTEEEKEMAGSRVKEYLYSLAQILQDVIVQINIQPALLMIPAQPVTCDLDQQLMDFLIKSDDRDMSLSPSLVISAPSLSVMSSGHLKVDLNQEIPLHRLAVPQEPGPKFPWTVNANSFHIFSIGQNSEPKFHLLEPLSIASTVAFNSHIEAESKVRSVGIVVHTDMPGVQINCSHEQVTLLKMLTSQMTYDLPKLMTAFSIGPPRQSKGSHVSRSTSTSGNIRPATLSSRTSSEHLRDTTISMSSPVESVSRDDSEEEEEVIDPSSVRVSFWIQWTVDKVGACLITRKSDKTGRRAKLCAVMEDLTTSVDYQDVFSKVTSKVGSLNVKHFIESDADSWKEGPYSGILFTSSDHLTKSLDSPVVTPRSPEVPKMRTLHHRKTEAKVLDPKQSHGFFSLIWTRAKGASISKHMEGKEQPLEMSRKQKNFVNEIIISMQPIDTVIWCPVIAEMICMILSAGGPSTAPKSDSDSTYDQPLSPVPPTPSPVKSSSKAGPRKPKTDAPSRSKGPTSSVSSFDKWFTSSIIPLLYFDLQEMRCFLPVQDHPEKGENAGSDLFLFKVSHVKLVPYADNPLPRMVMKKEMFRKAQLSRSSQKLGAPLEDRQYQLDITNLGLFTASWKDIQTVTDEEKRKVDPEIIVSQNPALEWNTSPPKQGESIVHMMPVVEEFSVCCTAAPAITVTKSNTDKTAWKPVIVCGHSVEANIASDVALYLSLSNITLAQSLLTKNFGALFKCLPSSTSPSPAPHPVPAKAKHKHSRADSGFDSDFSHRSQDRLSELGQKRSVTSDLSTSGVKVLKQKYKTSSVKHPVKTTQKARKIIPFDVLLTGREISMILFSQEEDSGICPFLLAEFSQPSFVASVSKQKQKVELSLYNMKVCGASPSHTVTESDLPTASDFLIPWFETCLGEPNVKTGVPPALFTVSATDFLSGEGAFTIDLGRPMKVNFSIDKGEQVVNFLQKLKSKFQRKRQVWPPAEELGSSSNPFASGLNVSMPEESRSPDLAEEKEKVTESLSFLTLVKHISLSTSRCIVTMATGCHDDFASTSFSISSSHGNMKVYHTLEGLFDEVDLKLQISGVTMETGLGLSLRPLVGPVEVDVQTVIHLMDKGPHQSTFKTVSQMTCGHIPVFFGQEHFNCLTKLVEDCTSFLEVEPKKGKSRSASTPVERQRPLPDPTHSQDDLRSGDFTYITEAETGHPLPNQIQFHPGGEGANHDGSMTWRYPEPRVLTRITLTPVPLRTASKDGEEEDQIDVPCRLEYWDEMAGCFQSYKELFVSETNTYHVSMGLSQRPIWSEGAVTASIWRMLLNPQSDESFKSLLADKNMILTPMALAASLRVDSCFSPSFVPVISLALKIGLVEIHLENHISQLGQVIPEILRPFTFDGREPDSQEFCLISSNDITVTSQLWKTPDTAIKIKMNAALKASLVNYSQLTMVPLIGTTPIEGSITVDQTDGGCLAEASTENVHVRVGQGTLHTLKDALHSWKNNKMPAADRVVSAYYILCNNTSVSLRLGQIATDKSLVLEPRQMHSYCWRTHKQQKQLLHICIEGWKNFHWSDPIGIDQDCTILRRLEHKDQEATLFIQIKSISPLQKQVIFHAKQSFVNHLTIPLEIYIQQSASRKLSDHEKETKTEFTQKLMSLEANSSLPSLVVEDKEIVGVKVKVKGQECDWSQQFAIAGEMKREKFVVEIPFPSNSSVSFCCTILEETHEGHIQRAILFSPSFWVRNSLPHSLIVNLSCRKNPDVQSEEVKGHGAMTPLYHISPSSPYFATFQLNSDTSPSSPAIPISLDSDVFVVVPKEPLHISDLLFKPSVTSSKQKWPFEQTDTSLSSSTFPSGSVSHPATDLNIHLSHDWSHVDSVVINVEPWCLVSNETEWSITIQDEDDIKSFIPAGAVIAPPKIQDKFVLTVSYKSREGCSQVVSLENEKVSPFLRPDQMTGKQLFVDGYVSLEIPFISEGTEFHEVCYVVVQSELKENIRLVTIRPRFILQNDTEKEIALKAVEVVSKEQFPPNILRVCEKLILAPKSTTSSIMWKRFESNSTDQKTLVWKRNMSVTVIDTAITSSCQATNERNWSKWIHVDGQNPRQPVPVPLESSGNMQFSTTPFVTVIHEAKGLTYLSLGVDPSPRMVITNQCSFPLHVGQAVPSKLFQGGIKVVEDTLELPDRCVIPPQRKAHYNMYPLQDVTAQVKICLAVAPFFSAVQLPEKNEDQVKSKPEWSEPIKIAVDSTPVAEIIALLTGSYVLVSSHVTSCQTNINIEVLSMESPTKGKAGAVQGGKTLREKAKINIFQKLKVRMLVKNITVSLMDEVRSSVEFVEVLRIHAKMGQLLSFPIPFKEGGLLVQSFQFAVGAIQVDNQDYRSGRYDFPVIFKGNESLVQRDDRVVSNFADIAEKNNKECFIALEMGVEMEESGKVAGLKGVTIHFNDAEVFIEDQFIFDMLYYCQTFPKAAFIRSRTNTSREVVPGNVKATLVALKGPISIQHLTIEPITVLASVHASMKIFVAVDRTVLNFGQFHTEPVFATISQLGQALSVHYTSGAIFKAGWVLGSLEILGNPAGLLRSVGSGLADTILLPYEGLTRGPTAFISGVAGGISSLIRQVTAGTLTSVTKFATSVSRNLDRLSLDSDHMIRQETARRRVPSHASEGLVQGLSHFGISILGAIAGIADQPIRGFQRAGSSEDSHASDHAREVISGFGKGLVGAVVKPIGGAAELVSQTGQGILHGTGLAEMPKQLTAQQIELRAKFINSRSKYTWKMLSTLSKPDLLMEVKVTSVTHHGLHHAGALLLTPEVLFVISLSEDTHQQAFYLDQTQCVPVRGSEEGLKFVVKGATTPLASPEVPETSDLIADFVDVSSSFVGSLEDLQCPSNEESSEASVNFDPTTFTFFMSPHHRQTFLSLFELCKKRILGEDFILRNDQDIASTKL